MNLQDVLERCRKTAAWDGQDILSLDQRNSIDDTPLHTVCSWGELEPVKVLIAAGADIRARGDKGSTPLLNAVIGRNPEVIRFLLRSGADPTAKNEWGDTALKYAVLVSAPAAVIDVLLKATPHEGRNC